MVKLSKPLQGSDRLSFSALGDRGHSGRKSSLSSISVHIYALLETLLDTLARIWKDQSTSFGFCTEAVYRLGISTGWEDCDVGAGIQFKCHTILINYDVGFPRLMFVGTDFAKENFGI